MARGDRLETGLSSSTAGAEGAAIHDSELLVDIGLARLLVRAQFPSLSDLPMVPVPQWGTDMAMFRLGEDLVARLPRYQRASEQVTAEAAWLGELAPVLPLEVPVVEELGAPADEYPFVWSIQRWVHGRTPDGFEIPDGSRAAPILGEFLAALHAVELEGGRLPGLQTGGRGGPLSDRDEYVRRALHDRRSWMDIDPVIEAWQRAVAAPQWSGPPRWLHGDLHPGNIVFADDSPRGVIDWGLVVGDPATDLMLAWNFDAKDRDLFRLHLSIDDDTWARGAGSAIYQWIGGLWPREPDNEARRVIDRVLREGM